MLSEGTTIGRYIVEGHLGSGGMGSVYRARLVGPQGFDKEVALKVLLDQNQEWQTSLAQEARLSASLRHRNIVDVYEFAEVDGMVLIAMEFVEGLSLTAAMAIDGAPPPSLALEIGMQACAGLGAAHAALVGMQRSAIVHRDIKPSNLMLSVDGTVKVVDFGIATRAGMTGAMGQDDMVQGTLNYMSPEQVQTHALDARSDIFSLGLVIYAMVSGQSMFGAERNVVTLHGRLEAFIADRLKAVRNEGWLPGIADILARALAVDPDERYSSVEDMEDDLDELMGTLPRGPRLRRWVRDMVRGMDTPADGFQTDVATSDLQGLLDETTLQEGLALPREPTAFVPSEPNEYIGHRDLVTRLVHSLRGSGGAWVLYGPQGVGKSRTATHLLGQLRSVGGFEFCWVGVEHAESVAEVVLSVGNTLGVDLSKLRDLDGQVDAVGHALSHRPNTVLVIDDISTVADPLLAVLKQWGPDDGSVRVLATCVPRVNHIGVDAVAVPPLREDDAVRLLRGRIQSPDKSDPVLLRRLVNALDCLPLAIELVAGQIDEWGLNAVERDIRDVANQAGEALDSMLERAWSNLSVWQKDALAQCVVFQAPFTLMAAESVIQLPAGSPWMYDVLEELHGLSWLSLQQTPQGPAFRVFASVRSFLRQQDAVTGGLDALQLRHALWTAERVGAPALRQVSTRTGINKDQQCRVLQRDILQALSYAINRRESALATQLASPAIEIICEGGGAQAALADLDKILCMPRLDDEDRGVVLSLRARVRFILGEREASLEGYREAIKLLDSGDPEVEAHTRIRFANCLGQFGDFEAAEAEGLRVVELVEQHDLRDHLAELHQFMARVYQFTRRPTLSLKHARIAKRAWTSTSSVPQSVVDYALGEAEINSLNFQTGYRILRETLDTVLRSGRPTPSFALALALPMKELGMLEELLEIMEWTLLRAQRSGHRVYQLYAKLYLGATQAGLSGTTETVRALFEEARAEASALGNPYLINLVQTMEASARLGERLIQGDADGAQAILDGIEAPAEGSFSVLREGHLLLWAHHALLAGDTARARELVSEARVRIPADYRFSVAVRLDLLEAWVSMASGDEPGARRHYQTACAKRGLSRGNDYLLQQTFERVRVELARG